MKRYCYWCDKDVDYRIVEKVATVEIRGVRVAYPAKIALCCECGKEIYVPEFDDANIESARRAYQEKVGVGRA